MERILQSLPSLTIVSDDCQNPSISVIHFVIEQLSKSESTRISVVGVDHHPSTYRVCQESRMTLIDCFSDPCGWLPALKDSLTDRSDTNQGFDSISCQTNFCSEYAEIIKEIRDSKKTPSQSENVIIIDSISFLVLHGGLQRALRFINQIQMLNQARLLLVLHKDLHEDKIVRTLYHAADIIISVAPPDEGQQDAICRLDLQKKRSNGSVSFKVR
jgi:hypothetical protein